MLLRNDLVGVVKAVAGIPVGVVKNVGVTSVITSSLSLFEADAESASAPTSLKTLLYQVLVVRLSMKLFRARAL